MDVKKVVINVGGRELSIETGRLAKQAHGSAYVQCGDSVVLVTACADRNPKADVDFLPLTVDYREYTYAAGKIPGGFFKREGRPTEREILVCRLIDRPLRPLFPEHYHQETQIIAVVLSAEPDINPDVLAINGASAALYISEIPFTTPVAAVRVGLVDGEFVLNPSLHQMETSLLDLVVVGTREAVVMVEAGAQEASEEEILRALDLAHAGIQNIIDGIETLAREVGKTKWQVPELVIDPDVIRVVEEKAPPLIEEALSIPEKTASYQRMDEHRQAVIDLFPAENEEQRRQAGWVFDRLKERLFRSTLLEKGIRPDRRAFDEIRSISGEVGMLP
ncbi:MAG TPA: polyribonucleotide nucleotidyltransferase, partial [Acidobacteriota bacterium]|nr:polyribonucleotide nucleotidyltransferase [Acidobacteriota bacterium]